MTREQSLIHAYPIAKRYGFAGDIEDYMRREYLKYCRACEMCGLKPSTFEDWKRAPV